MGGIRVTDGEQSYLRTLFLHPPSYAGFDGGAGARYQARREIRSFWYPTWLAQPAALVPGSRLIDAPPAGLTLADIRPIASEYELAILHTSTPSFAHDVRVAEALKETNPGLRIGFVGAHVAVNPGPALSASTAIDFVARNEFDFTIQEVARGRPLETILGLSFRSDGRIRHMPDRPVLEDMDALPFVVDVYKRDLVIEHYAIGYLLHPYVSLYTGRGCRSKCTFCLWPQTVGGHRYRTRSVGHVADEIALATRYFSQVREYFFDDDTLTDDLPRIEALARRLGKLGVTWSCNAKANVPYDTLKVLKDNGLRLLLVGYESGNQKILNNVKKGIRLDTARRFTRDAKALGLKIHGTFILGLPGETQETIQETIRFAGDIDPDTIQVSIAAPYPGTELFRQAVENGWLSGETLVDDRGAQVSALSYPHLLSTEISRSTEEFYRRFYFRPRKIFAIAKEMLVDRHVMRRRLREGREFLQFLTARRRETPPAADAVAAAPRAPTPARLQVVLSVPRRSPMVASVPAAVRAASAFATLESVDRVIFCSEATKLPGSWRRYLAGLRVPWAHVDSSVGSRSLAQVLDPTSPALVVAPNTIPEPRQLRDLLARPMTAPQGTTWMWQGIPVVAYYPDTRALLAQVTPGSQAFPRQALSNADPPRMHVPPDSWNDVNGSAGVREAERRLLHSLRQPSDGYLARFDRVLSVALSRALIRTPVTPNVITAVSLLVGLGGAALLASPTPWAALLGALLLWTSCILDGCDGEVARLKLLTSSFGARFDAAADDVVHLATFVAIAMHLSRARPDLSLVGPVALLLFGVMASMASVWWVINRYPSDRRLGFRRVYERIASRDYIYVVVVLTALGRLEWFLWAAAVGANLFWLSLWWWVRAQRT
jgi:hopanoid biosynthesis associated radical SAM protein HpnJ